MWWKARLRTLVACFVLEAGVLLGVPVQADRLEELLRSLSQPKHAREDREQADIEGE